MAVPTPAREVIDALGLEPHVEGGWYRVTWADDPGDGQRGAASVIHFLLAAGEVSHWHRVDAAEIWTHAAGQPLELSIADGQGRTDLLLGDDPAVGQRPHAVVPAGAWQAARPHGDFALVSCVVAPAFDPDGFELTEAGPDQPPPRR